VNLKWRHRSRQEPDTGSRLRYVGSTNSIRILRQKLAQTRAGARGALLLHACIPVSEFGDAWPEGLPVQIHAMDAARALVSSSMDASLFLYPGDRHLFMDPSLSSYEEDAAALATQRFLDFLSKA